MLLDKLTEKKETGEMGKFERIYNKQKTYMFHVAKLALKGDSLAEDAVQEAALRLLRNIDKVDDFCFLENCLLEIESNYWNSFKKENYNKIKTLIKKLISKSDNREKTAKLIPRLAPADILKLISFFAFTLYNTHVLLLF